MLLGFFMPMMTSASIPSAETFVKRKLFTPVTSASLNSLHEKKFTATKIIMLEKKYFMILFFGFLLS